MPIKTYIVTLLLPLLLNACCKHEKLAQDLCVEPVIGMGDCITDTNYVKPLILGKWNWTQSINSWTQEKTNPCTNQKNYSYEFNGNGTLKYYENGNYKYSGVFSFSQNQGISIQLFYNSSYHPNESGWVSVCGNYLIIDDSPVDGPKSIFLKAD